MLGNEAANIISSGVLSVLGALASYGVTVGVTYLKKKREALVTQLGVDKYNEDYKIAQDIYYIVEQQFKFIPQAGEQKRKEFDKLLIEKIPGISQEELNHFRETICGKVNSEVKSSQILAPAFDASKDVSDIVDTIKSQKETITPVQKATTEAEKDAQIQKAQQDLAAVQNENAQLKQKIATVQSTVTPVQSTEGTISIEQDTQPIQNINTAVESNTVNTMQ